MRTSKARRSTPEFKLIRSMEPMCRLHPHSPGRAALSPWDQRGRVPIARPAGDFLHQSGGGRDA
jgi:hypothetical protein